MYAVCELQEKSFVSVVAYRFLYELVVVALGLKA
jgi:hypothetical protein